MQSGPTGSFRLTAVLLLALIVIALMGYSNAWGAEEFGPPKVARALPKIPDPIAGQDITAPQLAHAVHVELRGLEANLPNDDVLELEFD